MQVVVVDGRQLTVHAAVAPVVDGQFEPGGPPAARRPGDELGKGVNELADLDVALFDDRPLGVLSRAHLDGKGNGPRRQFGRARGPEPHLDGLFAVGEQRHRRRLDGCPRGRLTKHLEGELVDDRAGVAHLQAALGLAAGRDLDRGWCQRCRRAHSRERTGCRRPMTG